MSVLCILQAYSGETYFWVTLDEFRVKKPTKLGREIIFNLIFYVFFFILIFNGVWHNQNYMRHTCTKGFLDLNFNQAVIDTILYFHKFPKFLIFSKIVFVLVLFEEDTNCFNLTDFMVETWKEFTFSFLPVRSYWSNIPWYLVHN